MSSYGAARYARGWRRLPGVIVFILSTLMAPGLSMASDQGPTPAAPTPARAGAALTRPADGPQTRYTLDSIIRYALRHNPQIRAADRDVESEGYGIDSAKADRMPKLDLGGGFTRYRYDMPLTPVVISLPLDAGQLPEFKRNIWDTGLSFRLPLFRGGRLMRGVRIAEMRKAVAEDMRKTTRQDLVYNLSTVYFKIAQLEELLLAHDASVKQLEAHKKNVELFLRTGTAPRLDLLKVEVELSHAVENMLLVKNNVESAYELLKTLMGVDDMDAPVLIARETRPEGKYPSLGESLALGLSRRPDFRAAAGKLKISEERVKVARAKRFPDIYAAGQYSGQAGNEFSFKENYYFGVKFSVPVFDGGLIRSEIDRARADFEKAREEERSLRLAIHREVRDAHLAIENSRERIRVTEKALESAAENLRVETLKYDTGGGTSTDVIDARTAKLRAETEYYQARFDREAALAYLRKATGDEGYEEEVEK